MPLGLLLESKTRAYPRGAPYSALFDKIDLKILSGTNAPAYIAATSVTNKKVL